ncbi:MAG: hypothetical protein R3C41_16285 [Calditrichia bacterium]
MMTALWSFAVLPFVVDNRPCRGRQRCIKGHEGQPEPFSIGKTGGGHDDVSDDKQQQGNMRNPIYAMRGQCR